MKEKRLKELIEKNKPLFWWIKEPDKISEELVVETILNYGTRESVKELFEILGTEKVAEIFFSQIKRKRKNYHPRTVNFFTLYFSHVRRDSNT